MNVSFLGDCSTVDFPCTVLDKPFPKGGVGNNHMHIMAFSSIMIMKF